MKGVLLLNLGAPATSSDVQPYLYNLFADKDIVRLPLILQPFQPTIAQAISKNRALSSQKNYDEIGGSPLLEITKEQATCVQKLLGEDYDVKVGMRYWDPFIADSVQAFAQSGIEEVIAVPLYPHVSSSTTGSSINEFDRVCSMQGIQGTALSEGFFDEGWYWKPIAEELCSKLKKKPDAHVLFTAHSVPVSYIQGGDPYVEHVERTVELISSYMDDLGFTQDRTLAYQSRVGPVEWVGPYVDKVIPTLRDKDVIVVPLSFVAENIETLYELDVEYRDDANKEGVKSWSRVSCLDTDSTFLLGLANSILCASS